MTKVSIILHWTAIGMLSLSTYIYRNMSLKTNQLKHSFWTVKINPRNKDYSKCLTIPTTNAACADLCFSTWILFKTNQFFSPLSLLSSIKIVRYQYNFIIKNLIQKGPQFFCFPLLFFHFYKQQTFRMLHFVKK